MTEIQDKLLDAALPEIIFDGWNMRSIERAGGNIGISKFDVKRAFPGGINQVLSHFFARLDAQMRDILTGDSDFAKLKIREKIARAVLVRLSLLQQNREAMRRASAHYKLPWNMAAGLKALWATVDAMWQAAGDTATDWNHYSKRALLANVYASTLQIWLDDESTNNQISEDFLRRRIENVMQIEKLKAKFKKT